MKEAEIHLSYFKQGDDLARQLDEEETVGDALEAHANQLEYAAETLRKIKEMTTNHVVEFQADTYFIGISGPDEVIDALIAAELAIEPLFVHEFDDEDEEDADIGDDEESLDDPPTQ